ncbi:MAG: META domain-containing protein [Solirubrobacteraceae bacterium]|nr:META domain-containing protein [Solirubrobacteraceae bacterium]
MPRLALLPLVLAGLAAALAGCGGDDGGPAAPVPPALPLEETAWLLDADTLGVSGAGEVVSWIRFGADGEVTGEDGCNRFTGGYEVDGENLRLGALASTRRACAGPADEVARRVTERLEAVRIQTIEDRTLRLRDEEGAALLVYAGSAPGVEGAWEARSVLFDDAIRGVLGEAALTAEFAAGGTVTGSTGCNTFSGTFEAEGTKIRIDPGAVTERACTDPEARRQEQGYLEALESAVRFDQVGPQLTLYDEQGRMAVTYARPG